MLWDISLRLGSQDAAYPGDPPYERRLLASLAQGQDCQLSQLSLSAHAGTHLDAPAHFLPQGRGIETYPLESFLLPALVVEAWGEGALGAQALEGLRAAPGRAILFKTVNSRQGRVSAGRWRDDYAHLSPGLAQACLALGAPLVGLDAPSVDAPHDQDYPAHRLLLGAGALILENLNLAQVPAGAYRLVCPPLSLAQGEAAPTRAFLEGPEPAGALDGPNGGD